MRTQIDYYDGVTESITSSDRAWSLLIDTYGTLLRRFEADMQREAGMSLSWFDVTANLITEPDYQMRMGELAERAVLSSSRISRVVSELVSEGLVERITDPTDGRGVIVKLTDEGRALQRKAGRVHLRGIREYFGAYLSAAQADSMVTALEAVLLAHERSPSPLKAWRQSDSID